MPKKDNCSIDLTSNKKVLGEQVLHKRNTKDFSQALLGTFKNQSFKKKDILWHQLNNKIDQTIKTKAFLLRAQKKKQKIKKDLSWQDKEKLYQGMLLTRATDNALKQLFLSGEMTYRSKGFQGKGFRSLGQEAIFGAPLKLKHGAKFIKNGIYKGDVAAPLIRDLGVFLAMSDNDIKVAINAQAGKIGKPCDGRDLHLGDLTKGLLIPSAPLAIATNTLIGFALSFQRKKESRVAISFIGDGGTSLGEWHEAINLAAVLKLPIIFCIENNQCALSTPVTMQSKVISFADKAVGYGIFGLTIDGNDVEEIASTFKFAADEVKETGPVIIELLTMRMCGHAHHDDMLYLGQDPRLDFAIPPLKNGGYANKELYNFWCTNDPIKSYKVNLITSGLLSEKKALEFEKEAVLLVKEAVAEIKARPWPNLAKTDADLVFNKPLVFKKNSLKLNDTFYEFSNNGSTYLKAIAKAIETAFLQHKNCILIGEDVAPPYGNAFMMFRDFRPQFHDRFINTPISENAIVGACVGMALDGLIPIGEIQFNDFVACSMDQVANNAAKLFFRTNLNVPMVLRLPYGGLRRAGPFHSQDTSPWFYRTAGLKIMAPSTPIDAFSMLIKAVNDPDPVLFYEHIALYRDPLIKQDLANNKNHSLDGALLMSEGLDLTMISYGAFSHKAKRVADRLKRNHGITADVIDLRYLMPVDFDTLSASIKKTAKVLLVTEDARTGSIVESIASKLGQELFSFLDAPVTVLGSRDIPVPYAPSLEDQYLLSEQEIFKEAKKLVAF